MYVCQFTICELIGLALHVVVGERENSDNYVQLEPILNYGEDFPLLSEKYFLGGLSLF